MIVSKTGGLTCSVVHSLTSLKYKQKGLLLPLFLLINQFNYGGMIARQPEKSIRKQYRPCTHVHESSSSEQHSSSSTTDTASEDNLSLDEWDNWFVSEFSDDTASKDD